MKIELFRTGVMFTLARITAAIRYAVKIVKHSSRIIHCLKKSISQKIYKVGNFSKSQSST